MDAYIEYLRKRMEKLSARGGPKWEAAKAEYSRAVAFHYRFPNAT